MIKYDYLEYSHLSSLSLSLSLWLRLRYLGRVWNHRLGPLPILWLTLSRFPLSSSQQLTHPQKTQSCLDWISFQFSVLSGNGSLFPCQDDPPQQLYHEHLKCIVIILKTESKATSIECQSFLHFHLVSNILPLHLKLANLRSQDSNFYITNILE